MTEPLVPDSVWRQVHHHHSLAGRGGIMYSHLWLPLGSNELFDDPYRPGQMVGPPCHLPCEAAGAEVWA